MKKPLIALLVLTQICFRCAVVEKDAEQPPKTYTIAQFMDIVQINGGSFSPDDSKLLFNSKETGIFNAYEIDLKSGDQKQLTTSTDNAIFAQSYFPEDNRVVYTSDKGGNEISHIYVRDDNGGVKDLINDSTAKAEFYGWSYNRKNLYYATNSRDKKFFDLHKIQVESPAKEGIFQSAVVYQNTEGLDPSAISNDDRYIVLTKSITTDNNEMYLLDTQTKKLQHISAHEGNVNYTPQYFSLDGKKFFYLTNEGGEFMYINTYDIATD